MPKRTKADIIKKIIDINPNDPGSLTDQYITKKSGKKLGPYWLYQTSIAGDKISIRVPKEEVDDIQDYIDKMKTKNKIHIKRNSKLLDTYMDAISDVSNQSSAEAKKD